MEIKKIPLELLISKLSNFKMLKFLSMKNYFDFSGKKLIDLSRLPDSVKFLFINNNLKHEETLKNFSFNINLKNLFLTGEYIFDFYMLIKIYHANPSKFYTEYEDKYLKIKDEFLEGSLIGKSTKIHMV
jgi:hypothetical protein